MLKNEPIQQAILFFIYILIVWAHLTRKATLNRFNCTISESLANKYSKG